MAVVVKIPHEPLLWPVSDRARGHGLETGPSGEGVVVNDLRRTWRDDQRGAIVTQTLLILPLFILTVFASFEVWKVLSIKHSLHSATYQATRYLSLNPVAPPYCPYSNYRVWQETAWELICREIQSNPLAVPPGEDLCARSAQQYVTVTSSESCLGGECDQKFEVEVKWHVSVSVPFLDLALDLSDKHEGWIAC